MSQYEKPPIDIEEFIQKPLIKEANENGYDLLATKKVTVCLTSELIFKLKEFQIFKKKYYKKYSSVSSIVREALHEYLTHNDSVFKFTPTQQQLKENDDDNAQQEYVDKNDFLQSVKDGIKEALMNSMLSQMNIQDNIEKSIYNAFPSVDQILQAIHDGTARGHDDMKDCCMLKDERQMKKVE